MTKNSIQQKLEYNKKYPFVSICTPTFNRRPFIPIMIECFQHQIYPKAKLEWIIIDDGTDKIEDLVSHIPEVKYFKYDEKMTLGKKRNLLNEKAKGDIIIYMDDDDYYPPERVSHAVDMLKQNPKALCAGSSAMCIYFKHINKMIQFGPYGPNHSTAATFAFKRELLSMTKFDDISSVAEEKHFLKDYTIPFVQLESRKSILVFSHNHNSFDKKILLKDAPNDYVKESVVSVGDFIKEKDVECFFMNDIDGMLNDYEYGKPENKPDILKQMQEISERREKIIKQHGDNQKRIQEGTKNNEKLNDMTIVIDELLLENKELKNKVAYLEEKITKIIKQQIEDKKKLKDYTNIQL
jgi:glycosyltransferase involved in cell wall biosynthesis